MLRRRPLSGRAVQHSGRGDVRSVAIGLQRDFGVLRAAVCRGGLLRLVSSCTLLLGQRQHLQQQRRLLRQFVRQREVLPGRDPTMRRQPGLLQRRLLRLHV